jgi:predicted MFS family arabinose efflux permease
MDSVVAMRRSVESPAPAKRATMGDDFRRLLAASWVGNLGDGIALAAGPLLVASETSDPVPIAMAALLQRLPWLLFGLFAGVVADRFDRRTIVAITNLLRAAVLVALSVAVATGAVSTAVVLVAMFLLGTAETFVDTTKGTLLPMVVAPAAVGVGNARLVASHVVANQLAGPSIGAVLFAVGAALPFVTQATCVLLAAVLVSRITAGHEPDVRERHSTRADIAAGVRWLWHHPPVRTLALTIVTFNVTFGATWSVLVLYARERLGLGEIGFGALMTTSAVGGLLGTLVYGRLERRLHLGVIMRAGLVIETLTHLVLAITTTPVVAFGVMFVFGMHASVWGTTSTSVRQRAVPMELQGRVASVYLMGVFGGIVVGSAVGGVIARVWGVTATLWFGFAGSALILVAIWGQLMQIAHADAEHIAHPAHAPPPRPDATAQPAT